MSETARPAKETAGYSSAALMMVVMLSALVLLPLLYVLSVGPVIMMIERDNLEPEFWEWFYGPLEWLHEHVEITRPFLDWYVRLWR